MPSATLNALTLKSQVNSDWLSMFYLFISRKNYFNGIVSLCCFYYSWGVDYCILKELG